MMSRLFLIATLLSLTICGRSQQFKADSLRVLPNDISASMEPVYDLNNDICALVKVVCSHDFAFSSPLGIAKRRNETGEVWLYLPEGSMLLTIKSHRPHTNFISASHVSRIIFLSGTGPLQHPQIHAATPSLSSVNRPRSVIPDNLSISVCRQVYP